MLLVVYRYGFVLVVVLVSNVYSTCLLSRSCPCGTSGKSYKRCFETLFQQYSCDSWLNCQTCEDYNEYCVTCPPGRYGLTCKNVKKELKKRDLSQKHEHDFSAPEKECTFSVTGNSSFNCTTGAFGQVSCDVTCHDKPLGRYHCFPGFGWNSTLPRCQSPKETSCKQPGVFENGIIEDFQSDTDQFPIGTTLRFLCREGYKLDGPEAIYCLRNLSWSKSLPVCRLIPTTPASVPTCKRPGPVENGFILNDVPEMRSFPLESDLSFRCREGYKLIGANVIHCLPAVNQFAYWSDLPPICKALPSTTTSRPTGGTTCQNPGTVENGFFENYPHETESFSLGVALIFRCKENYERVGPQSIYCILPGKWSADPPKCRLIPTEPAPEIFCNHPGMVVNGTFDKKFQSPFPVGTDLTFHCTKGNYLEGKQTIYCLRSGKWSAAPPTCKPIPIRTRKEPERGSRIKCKQPGPIENGIHISSSSLYTVGKRLKFRCREGYTMIGQDTILCESSGEWSSIPPKCSRTKNIPDCGRVFQELYKLNGKHTRSDWPWTVALSTVRENTVEKMFCGGALLNSRTVLTAAHCVTGARNIKLHFGNLRPVSEQVRNISKIIIHPEFDDETHANDVALLKFDHHVYYDTKTQPICLPTLGLSSSGKNLFPGKTTYVTGYGLEFVGNQSSTPSFKVFELPVQSEGVCEPVCREQGLVSCHPNTFCAGYLKDIKECIYGGTPLVVYHIEKNRYTLEGVVTRAESARNSWNGRCKRAESYTTFTNVTHYMPFIYENLN